MGPVPPRTGEWISVGGVSYALCVCVTYRWKDDPAQAAFHQRMAAEVPGTFLQLPMAAFAAVLVLNLMNLVMRQNTTRFNTNLLLLFINCCAFTTDILIMRGSTVIGYGAGSGRLFHPLRYLQWAHTTPTLLYMLWLSSDVPFYQFVLAVLNDVAMVLTGLASTWTAGYAKVGWGLASFITFFAVLYYLHLMVSSVIRSSPEPETRLALRVMQALMMVLWNAFPVVWLLAEVDMISPALEHISWGVCDWVAKAVFTSQLWQQNIASVEERKQAALQQCENSNRGMIIDELNALVRAKDELVHLMTHELRTPLLGIIALSSSLLRDLRAPVPLSTHERFLSLIRSSCVTLLNIINTTLSFATHGKQQVDREAVSLKPLVDEVVTLLKVLARDGVQLTNEIRGDLPLVAADRTKLHQIFFNLLGNSCRFTHAGYIRVRAVHRQGEDSVDIVVTDTGIGVAQEKLDTIFQPYSQGGAEVSAKYGGNGLGLYLVKLALDAHQAETSVESKVGEGMTFRFRLQLADEELVALTAARAVQRATAGHDGVPPPGWSSSSGAATPNTAASVVEPGLEDVHNRNSGSTSCNTTPRAGVPSAAALALAPQSQRNSGDAAALSNRSNTSGTGALSAGDGVAPTSPNLHVSTQRSSADTAVSLALGLGRVGTAGSNSPLGTRSSLAAPARSPCPGSGAAATAQGVGTAASGQLAGVGSESEALDVHLNVLETMSAVGTACSSGRGRAPWQSSSSLGREAGQAAVAAGKAVVAHSAGRRGEEEGVIGRMKVPHRFRSRSLQILSVDDDMVNQVVAEQIMRSQKTWKILKAYNGPQCLEMIERAQDLPDLILLDIMMPGMNGYEVCKELRKHYSSALLPIIMVSAKTADEDVVQALRSGADDYITKPISRGPLVEKIKAALRVRDVGQGFDDLVQLQLVNVQQPGQQQDGAPATPCCGHWVVGGGVPPATTVISLDACILVACEIVGLEERVLLHQMQPTTPLQQQQHHQGGSQASAPATPLPGAHAQAAASNTLPPQSQAAAYVSAATSAVSALIQQVLAAKDSPVVALAQLSPTRLVAIIPVKPTADDTQLGAAAGAYLSNQQQGAATKLEPLLSRHSLVHPPATSAVTLDRPTPQPAGTVMAEMQPHEHVLPLCSSLLQLASAPSGPCLWPDRSPMQLKIVIHAGPTQILSQGPLQPAPNASGSTKGTADATSKLPAAQPTAVQLLVPSADVVGHMLTEAQQALGCVIATAPAHSVLAEQGSWRPWPRGLTLPAACLPSHFHGIVSTSSLNGSSLPATPGSRAVQGRPVHSEMAGLVSLMGTSGAPESVGGMGGSTVVPPGSGGGAPSASNPSAAVLEGIEVCLFIAELGPYKAALRSAASQAPATPPVVPSIALHPGARDTNSTTAGPRATPSTIASEVGSGLLSPEMLSGMLPAVLAGLKSEAGPPGTHQAAGGLSPVVSARGGSRSIDLGQQHMLQRAGTSAGSGAAGGAAAAAAAYAGSRSLADTQQLVRLESQLEGARKAAASARERLAAAERENAQLAAALTSAQASAGGANAEREMWQRLVSELRSAAEASDARASIAQAQVGSLWQEVQSIKADLMVAAKEASRYNGAVAEGRRGDGESMGAGGADTRTNLASTGGASAGHSSGGVLVGTQGSVAPVTSISASNSNVGEMLLPGTSSHGVVPSPSKSLGAMKRLFSRRQPSAAE